MIHKVNTMENTEMQKEKIATSVRIEADLHAAIARLASDEDRPSQANMIERLLKTHPRVQAILEAESTAVTV